MQDMISKFESRYPARGISQFSSFPPGCGRFVPHLFQFNTDSRRSHDSFRFKSSSGLWCHAVFQCNFRVKWLAMVKTGTEQRDGRCR